jgi:glycosyltransferase involved in cell wall biosynthesis
MRLRILQVETVNTGFWGVERHVVRLASGLLARGHAVGIAARPESYMADEAPRLGAEVLPCRIRKRGDWQRLPGVVRLLRRFRPDVVHLHCPVDLGIVSLAARLLRVRGIFCTRHGAVTFSNAFSARIHSRVLHRFVAVSEFVRTFMIERGVPEAKATTIYPGLDVTEYPEPSDRRAPIPGTELPPEMPVAVLVGRMTEEKGHELFLRALAMTPGVTGLLVGDGPLRSELESLAASLGVAGRTVWAGGQMDVRPWIAASDIVCVPSPQHEGLPWVVLEGMACGKPLVASNAGGIPEAVCSETGIICPKRDLDAFAAALSLLASDPDRRRELGKAGRRVVAERFSVERWLDDIERLYRDVLAGTPPASGRVTSW